MLWPKDLVVRLFASPEGKLDMGEFGLIGSLKFKKPNQTTTNAMLDYIKLSMNL